MLQSYRAEMIPFGGDRTKAPQIVDICRNSSAWIRNGAMVGQSRRVMGRAMKLLYEVELGLEAREARQEGVEMVTCRY